jgi:hypothetical protein
VGSAAGLVVAGAPDRGATIVAVDERGLWGVWTEPSGPGSALRRTRTLAPRTPVAAKTAFELTVRVRPDGLLLVQVDDETPLEARLEHAPAEGRRVGLFTKNGTWRFEDACVELVP